MQLNDVPDLRNYLRDWAEEVDLFRQNRLMSPNQFLTFVKDRGVAAWRVKHPEPSDFLTRGLLDADNSDSDGTPQFHPFRLYPLQQIIDKCAPRIPPAIFLDSDSALKTTHFAIKHLPSADQLHALSRGWNNIVTFAAILEPIYWPRIVESERLAFGNLEKHYTHLDIFRAKVTGLVRSLDPGFWRNVHEQLRIDAASMDSNADLYMLLRVATWHERKRLRGTVSGALWIRHMAEVIRRAFEEIHNQRWPEEDQAFGYWPAGARYVTFGSERPFDDVMAAKPYVAHRFGLFTGSKLRWYVEGDTEFFAVLEMAPDISRFGVELVNLKGGIASGNNSAPLRLEALLAEDRSLRRFSMVSFDGDVLLNIKYIRRQVELGNIVGLIKVNTPDYEFANFSTSELVEIAATLDEANGFPGDPVRSADWRGIHSSRAFEETYVKVSARKVGSLKDEKWGRTLARWAMQQPDRPEGTRRPLWEELRAALHAWSADYEHQRDCFTFDPVTLKLISRQKAPVH